MRTRTYDAPSHDRQADEENARLLPQRVRDAERLNLDRSRATQRKSARGNGGLTTLVFRRSKTVDSQDPQQRPGPNPGDETAPDAPPSPTRTQQTTQQASTLTAGEVGRVRKLLATLEELVKQASAPPKAEAKPAAIATADSKRPPLGHAVFTDRGKTTAAKEATRSRKLGDRVFQH